MVILQIAFLSATLQSLGGPLVCIKRGGVLIQKGIYGWVGLVGWVLYKGFG